jgi:hypothetical protein
MHEVATTLARENEKEARSLSFMEKTNKIQSGAELYIMLGLWPKLSYIYIASLQC